MTYYRCLFVLLILVFGASSNTLAKELSIGAMLHLSGDFAMQGEAFREGVELAVEELRAEGRDIRVAIEDTQYQPGPTVRAAKRFLEVDKIHAGIVATIHEAKYIAPLFQKAKVPLIVLWDSAPELEELGDYVFGIGTWLPGTGETAAHFSRTKLKALSAVILNSQTEWSLAVSDSFREEWKKVGGRVLEQVSFNPDEEDFRTTLLRVKHIGPDVVYAPIDGRVVSFFKQRHQLGLDVPIITSDNLSATLVAVAPDPFEGVYQTQSADPDYEETQRMLKRYLEKFGKQAAFPLFSAWGYDAVHLFDLASSGEKGIKEELYAVQRFKGASGTISINADGSSRKSVHMFQVKESKLSLVQD